MYRLTDVVKHLIIINAVIFIAINLPLLNGLTEYFILRPVHSDAFKPVQLVTHMFMHGSIGHLFFNMLALYFFGPNVEALWGPRKFLFFYLFCGIGAMVTHIIMSGNSSVVGASGAIAGVLLSFAVMFPNARVMLLIPPIPMKAKHLILIILGIDLYLGLSNYNSGIAHFAHLGGALFGFLLILYWRKFPSNF